MVDIFCIAEAHRIKLEVDLVLYRVQKYMVLKLEVALAVFRVQAWDLSWRTWD